MNTPYVGATRHVAPTENLAHVRNFYKLLGYGSRGTPMNELFNYINDQKWTDLFHPKEGSHIIPHTYNIIKAAARDQADTFSLTPNEFIWSKEGRILGRFPTSYPEPPTYSFYNALKEIINLDKFVGRFLKIVSETENEIVCELLLNEQN